MSSQSVSVLLIEDNPGDARLIQEMLAEARPVRFSLTVVDRLADGFEQLTRSKPDVVLLDLSLPDSHGLDTLVRFRAVAPDRPIVVLTGLDDDTVGIEAVKKGAQDYLSKSYVDSHLLTRTLNHSIARKEIEEEEHGQRALAEALRDTAEALNSTLDLNEVLDVILASLERVVPHDTASVRIIEPPGTARRVRSHGYSKFGIPDNSTESGQRLPVDALTGLRQMIESRQPVLIADTNADPTWTQVDDDPTLLRSYVAAPIISEDAVVGFLSLRSITPGFFTHAHLTRLQAFANQVAIAIHNAQSFAAERDQRVLAEALSDSAATLTSTLDIEVVMERILDQVGRVVSHDTANIMLIENNTARIVAQQSLQDSIEESLSEHRFSLDLPHLHEMVTSGLPFLAADTRAYPGWVSSPDTAWVCSYVAAPIWISGNVIGFLNLNSSKPDFFTLNDLPRLQAFADQAAIAIENARLYQELEAYNQFLEQAVAERTAKMQASEARYRAAIEDQTDIVVRFLPGGVMTFVNRAYCEYVQRQPEELLGTSFFEMSDAERSRMEQHVASLNRENPVAAIEVHEIAPDGTPRWFHWIYRMIFDEKGNFVEYQGVGRDITERKKAEERLRLSDLILTNMGEGICLIGTDGIIVYNNPKFEQLFGYQPGELSGLHISVVNAPTDENPAETSEEIMQVLKAQGHWHGDMQNIKKDGTVFWCSVHITAFEHSEYGPVWLTINEDITERKQAEVVLRHALAREMEVSELKIRFLSMASHDLRTPLAVIQSGVDIVEQYGDRLSTQQKQDRFQQMRDSISHMVDLLNDILIIGRIEAGKLEFDPEPLDLVKMCDDILNEVQMSIGPAHKFDFTLTGTCPKLMMDSKLIRHILNNLLSNATKYSPDGSTVTIEMGCDDSQVVLRIQDQGIGIPAEDQPRLFEAFHRARNVGPVHGTGLGLAIVKQAVDLHGGTIMFESAVGTGTTFTVALPRVNPQTVQGE